MTAAMAELLLSGCTTTTDHHYVFPPGLEDAIDIEVAAARRLGIRAVLTRGSMNLSQRDGGLPPDSVVQDEDTILADSKRLVDRHHQRGDDAMVQIALAPCSPFSVTTSLMQSDGRARRAAGGPAAHASGRDRGREPLLHRTLRLPPARLSGELRLARRADLAGARHPFQRKRNRAARPGADRGHPLPVQQSGAGLRRLPGLRHGGSRRARSASVSTAPRPTTPPT